MDEIDALFDKIYLDLQKYITKVDDIEEAYIISPILKWDEKFLSKFEIIQNGDIQQYIRFGL